MKRTPNYGLPIVENNDRYSKEEQNSTMSIIDSELHGISETLKNIDIEGNSEIIREIVDARNNETTLKNRLDKVDSKINEVSTSLEKSALQSNIEGKTCKRMKLLFNSDWCAYENATTCIDQINRCHGMYEGTVICVRGDYDSISKTFKTRGNIQILKDSVNYAINKGFTIKSLKFHCKIGEAINDIGIDKAIDEYYSYIASICNEFSHVDYEYINVLNEDFDVYLNINYTNNILKLIDNVKSLGKKTGICTATIRHVNTIDERVMLRCDAIFIDYYDPYSFTGRQTTIDQIKINLEYCINMLADIKNRYPQHPIIMSEIGINKSWLALSNPETYYSYSNFPSEWSSTPLYMVWRAILETGLGGYVDEVWAWYYVDSFQTDQVRKLNSTYIMYGI